MPIHQSGNYLRSKDKTRLDNNACKQEELVIKFYQTHPNKNFSAEQIHARLLSAYPLTSCRRVLSDLFYAGFLEKDIKKRHLSQYGVYCVTYIRKVRIRRKVKKILPSLKNKKKSSKKRASKTRKKK